MTWFLRSIAALAASTVCAALAAQSSGCPYQRAQLVPSSQFTGPSVPCGTGITIEVGGVRFASEATACPVYVVFVPDYDIPVSTNTETYTESIGKVDSIVFRLQCVKEYFLFISVGTSCVHLDKFSNGTFSRLTTLQCRGGTIRP